MDEVITIITAAQRYALSPLPAKQAALELAWA